MKSPLSSEVCNATQSWTYYWRNSSLCRKRIIDKAAWAVLQSRTAHEQGRTVTTEHIVPDHCLSLPRAWKLSSHLQSQGSQRVGSPSLCCASINKIVCMTSSASKGWKSPVWGNSAWYGNLLSCSSCLQIKYASKPPVYTNWFWEELYLCECARSGPLQTSEKHKQLLHRKKI